MTPVRRDRRAPWGSVVAALVAGLVPAVPAQAAEKLRFNRDVRPILAENCFACHGADSAARKGDLRLDVRDAAVKAEAIAPGKPDSSEALARIALKDGDEGLMPPLKSHKSLTAAQKETLKRWIAEGAEYEPHWAFIPPARPAVPAVRNAAWVRNPVDAFLLAELEKRGLQPAPEADKPTLARRLSLDLTGLPPKPAEVAAFVADTSPGAYERYVARLMATPQWGEHRGRYWLDAARYADTHGIHFDNFREVWTYRDWVINALNQNVPFDQFTVEQLAGDLLPNPTLDQQIATGFNRCNITTNEGGAINEEYLVLYTRDRTETASQVWLGLTTGCAVCHDHKFDPVSQKEFYSLSAFFNNTTQGAMDGNVKNTPPIVAVPRREDRARFAAVGPELKAAQAKAEARKTAAKADFAAWLKAAKPADVADPVPTAGLAFHAPLAEGEGKAFKAVVGGADRPVAFDGGYEWATKRDGRKTFTIKAGNAVELPEVGNFDHAEPFTVATWVHVGKAGTTGAVLGRMDEAQGFRGWDLWLQGDRVGMHLINTYPGDALKVVGKKPLAAGKWHHVAVAYDGSGKAAGMKVYVDGEAQPTDVEADTLKSTTKTGVPFKFGQRHTSSRVADVAVQDVRIYNRALTGIDAKALSGSQRVADLVALPADKRTPKETEELFAWWLGRFDEPSKALAAAVGKLQAEEAAIRARGTVAHVSNEKPSPAEAYILARGDYDKRGEKVAAGTPQALPAFPADLPRNRLGFAKWLLRADHPLTARVTVNRFWQELYGNGLVRTSGDFGTTGELPSHPDLLDWLAVEFREKGWDVKQFFTLLVTSSAYRQAATATPEKLEKDRDNRLLSRGPRFRMDAEMVRDYALAAGGLLVEEVGGPSVKPYQPDGVWEAVAMPGSDTRNYKRDAGGSLYRRSLYTFWKRAAPPAFLDVMNAPNRETCVVRRDRTNTPLQALLTLNDVQYVEAARALAEAALKDGGATDDARIDFVAKKLLARPFRPEEVAVVKASLAGLLADFAAKPAEAKKLVAFGEAKADPKLDPAALAGWTMLVNELLNLDEVLNK